MKISYFSCLLAIIFTMLSTSSYAVPTIDVADSADVALVVGCAVMFGLGLLAGK